MNEMVVESGYKNYSWQAVQYASRRTRGIRYGTIAGRSPVQQPGKPRQQGEAARQKYGTVAGRGPEQ